MSNEVNQFDGILKTLILKEDAEQFKDSIDQAIDLLFQSKVAFEDALGDIFSREHKKEILRLLDEQKIVTTQLTEVEAFFRDLKDRVSNIPVLQLTLAIHPSEKLLRNIQDWVEENVNMKVFMETKVNPKLIGGLMISINGYYHDYSLSKLMKM
jgi:F0F1-type ATP synthase delta subunit